MASVPVALWNLKVPAGGVKVPGYEDEEGAPLPYRITMAAIDSSSPSSKPSTLKLHKRIVTFAEEEDEEEEEDEKMDEGESTEEEFIICTLEAGKTYQQPLDLTMPEDDEIYFSCTGDLPIYLSGNYVTPISMDSDESDLDEDDEDFDLSPDSDELKDIYLDDSDLEDQDEEENEEDELDDLEGRIEKITEETVAITPKGKKRPLEDADEAPELVDTSKLTKSQKKKLKKQKLAEDSNVNGSSKKAVQFAPELEQGPTVVKGEPAKPALNPAAAVEKKKEKKTLANGVVIDEHAGGQGKKAVNGTKLGIRYIGKLAKNGKEFDKNTKGKPFRFVLGKGEVIKGWDIGLQGIQLGGERKILIPAAAAYGNKSQSGIPANSDLVFDVKCVSLD